MFGRVVVENGVKKVVPLTADCGSGNPCGAIITVYQNTVPNGYLPLGVQYDITQFPVLYSILSTDTIPTASALGLPTLTTGQYIIKATSGINENQADNILSALQPVDTVTSGNMHSVTSNAVANYTVDRIEVNESRPASSNAVANAVNSLSQTVNGKANGNGGVYYRTLTPREFNTASTLTDIVASYPDGSLIIISIGWEEYETFQYAGYSGYIMRGYSSCRAWGQLRRYYNGDNYSIAFNWIDTITVDRYTGIYSI